VAPHALFGLPAVTLVYLPSASPPDGFASNAGAAAIGIEPAARAWSVPMAIFESLRVLFVPYPLNALRTLTMADVASTANRIAPFLALLGVALVVAWRRRDPLARAGGLLLLIPLVPSLPIPPFVGSYVEERSLCRVRGACLLVGSIYAAVRSAIPRAGVILAILAVGSRRRRDSSADAAPRVEGQHHPPLASARPIQDPLPHIMLADYFSNDETGPRRRLRSIVR
jgi:hypothetical protein